MPKACFRLKPCAYNSGYGIIQQIEIAKKIRGYVASQLFRMMPWLKKRKWEGGYFWNSGLWNPAYDIRGISDIKIYERYLDKQKYSSTNQTTLTSY